MAWKDGQLWVMAVYFPRGQKDFQSIKRKFLDDLSGVEANNASAMAFVTNQELTLTKPYTGPKSVRCTRWMPRRPATTTSLASSGTFRRHTGRWPSRFPDHVKALLNLGKESMNSDKRPGL